MRIGIDLGGTKLSGVVLDPAGAERVRLRMPSPQGDYAATLDAVTELVHRLEEDAGGAPVGEALVGVGTPGCWHRRLGCMKNCNSTWLNDRPLLHDLEELLGARVRLANDADCLALSEATDGAAAGVDLVFAVILGTGVGGAVVSRGGLVRGPNGLTGEWGHTPLPYFGTRVFDEGRVAGGSRSGDRSHGGAAGEEALRLESRLGDRACYCGRLNCIETFLSGPGLAATHRELWQETASAEAIAAAESPAAARTFELYQHMLARSLAQVVNLLDPGVIVMGGGVSKVAELYPVLERLVPDYAFSSIRATADVAVDVRPAHWGDDSGVRGAARLWDDTATTRS